MMVSQVAIILVAVSVAAHASADPIEESYDSAGDAVQNMVLRPAQSLGSNVSGAGQSTKPGCSCLKPLEVMVRDTSGAPVAGVPIRFHIEQSFNTAGIPYHNGSLIALTSPVEWTELHEQIDEEGLPYEENTTVTVLTDQLGFAGVGVVAGPHLGTLTITAAMLETDGDEIRFAIQVINPRWGFLLWSGLLGGIAVFMLGMRMTSSGLAKIAGNRLQKILSQVTDNRFLGLITGTVVTALMQSSSASTVMVVSFTNAGLMALRQTLSIILGAGIGATLTVQIIAFSIKEYALFIVFFGFIASAMPSSRYRALGTFVLGFGLIFMGMGMMGDAMDPLREHPLFQHLIVNNSQGPLVLMAIAMLFTGIIQSASATIGIVLTFAFQGLIDLQTAVPIILGANIGTCVTAMLASLGTRREARQVAIAHIGFKFLAALAFIPVLPLFTDLVAGTSDGLARQIANCHTLFNVGAALLFLPLLVPAQRLLEKLIPEKPDEERTYAPKYIDDKIMENPVLALAQVTREISRMGDTVIRMLKHAYRTIGDRDDQKRRAVIDLDDKVDALDTALRQFLTRMSQTEMTPDQAAKVGSLLYMVHHLETIGDLISKNLMELAEKLIKGQMQFSEEGYQQWADYFLQVSGMLQQALAAFATNDQAMAAMVVERKEEMAVLARNLHFSHLERLSRGIAETAESSDIHIHLLTDLRRIMSNTVSIASAVVNEYRIPDIDPATSRNRIED